MPQTASIALTCATLLAGVQAQEPTHGSNQSVARWVAKLGPDDTRRHAFAHLLTLGTPAAIAAVQALAEVDFETEPERFDSILHLIEALGPESVPTLDTLWTLCESATAPVQCRVADCLLTIALFSGTVSPNTRPGCAT